VDDDQATEFFRKHIGPVLDVRIKTDQPPDYRAGWFDAKAGRPQRTVTTYDYRTGYGAFLKADRESKEASNDDSNHTH